MHTEVRRQLEKILAHDLFTRSVRMCRFLRFTVERTLDGKADELKEYLIGVEVFDRKQSYDPRVDPIVRVEARRLRAKLKGYYETDGRADAVIIEFAPGSYAPKFRTPRTAPVERPANTVAVMPFANLSPSGEAEYLSDGLTEELIHALTKLPSIRVVAWTTAARMRDQQHDIVALGRQLNVGAVLTGSVRLARYGLRVRAQLIDATSGVYLWSETFDRQMQDVFAIQEEIAQAIVRTLRVQLEEAAHLSRTRTSISAYDWYLKGRYLMHQRTPEHLSRSVQCFQRAIEADSRSALAYAGLADAYTLLVDYGSMAPSEGIPLAKAAVEHAIALDPDLGEAYTSLALIRGNYDWQWQDAEQLYLRSIALNPGYATSHHWLAIDHYALLGCFEKAFSEIEIAAHLDPLSSIILEGRAYLFALMRDYEKAIAGYRDILRLDPKFYKAYTSMGRAYGWMGHYSEALALLDEGRAIAGDLPTILAAMGQLNGYAGNRSRACEMLARLEELSKTRYIATTCFATVHIGLGEFDRALDYLEAACERREAALPSLKVHPQFDPLRDEPRFQALLQRIGLA
jgi:serine/threonine-protein kinase